MFSIGSLGREAGVKVPTIRYYEQIGLMPSAERTEGGQRRYDKAALNRLRFIRHSRDLGFPLDAIRDLLSLGEDPDQPCHVADAIARTRLADVRARISQLQRLECELARIASACAHGSVGECEVIRSLSDHENCAAEH